MSQQPKIRALLSVSDKRGLASFAAKLVELNVELIATGGTYRLLRSLDIPAIEISQYTQFPEIFDGRVKTLHPKVHGGILARPGLDDEVMQEHDIPAIDLVVVNLYPFQQTVTKEGATPEEIIENIDIGGPTMLRAAAKNFARVTVLVDPEDYDPLIDEISNNKKTSLATRQRLAQKAFTHTAVYDTAISQYFSSLHPSSEAFPETFSLQAEKIADLRYGENPHQKAAYYRLANSQAGDLAQAQLLQGKQLSFNNLVDGDAALACVRALDSSKPACVIVKHATPCGGAYGETLVAAYEKAYRTDPVSAFGGIVAVNQMLDADTVRAMQSEQFVEVLLAPAVSDDAKALLEKKPNLRVLICGSHSKKATATVTLHSVQGGLLIQESDSSLHDFSQLKIVTARKPNAQELEDMHFAWIMVKFAKSNAIVYAKAGATYGIGTGQTSRVFSAECGLLKAKAAELSIAGTVMASDAFFPFSDSIVLAAKAGVTAIIQPGGSVRDQEVIAAADQAGIAMVFTGIRHFRH
jgi:phosphoribosylaminoimidazolecarboxamide formyltransferase/IMP cyclohydrolase